MSNRNYWVYCDDHCKFPAMTKEQTLAAITQAVTQGTIGDIDTGFVTTIKTITGTPLKFFVGRQAEYDALSDEEKTNLFAIISNDTTKVNLEEAIADLNTSVDALQRVTEGVEKRVKIFDEENSKNLSAMESVIFQDAKTFLGRKFEIATDSGTIATFKFYSINAFVVLSPTIKIEFKFTTNSSATLPYFMRARVIGTESTFVTLNEMWELIRE